MVKNRAMEGQNSDAFSPSGAVALIGSGPTSRAIKRTLDEVVGAHVVQVGVDNENDEISPCALAAEIADCKYLIFAPNFDDLDAALMLGSKRRATLLALTGTILEASRKAQIEHVVLITTAMVYGAVAGQEPLPDDAPRQAERDEGLVGDALAVEDLAEQYSDLNITLLRPAALVGPEVDTAASRHFEAPRILVLRQIPVSWQFAHIDDVASAVMHTLQHRLFGPVAVGSPGTLTQAEVEQMSGMRRIEVPESVARTSAERLYRVGALPLPPTDLTYVTRSWAIEANRLRESGWDARYDNAECFRELLVQARKHHALAGRRIGGRDAAALGAAGAAVALLGTAAVWRRARSNRRR